MVKAFVTLLIVLSIGISIAPFIEPGIKIEWITYFGIPLVIVTGSIGLAFILKRFEVVIGGVVTSVLWPILLDTVRSVLATL